MGLFGPPNIEKLKAKKDVQGLIKALSYPKDEVVRISAAQVLGELGDRQAINALIIMLEDKALWVRHTATRSLGKIADPQAVDALIALCKREPDNLAALEGLIESGSDQVTEILLAALRSYDVNIRVKAAEGLNKLDWKPTLPEDKAAAFIASKEWTKLKKLGHAAVEELSIALEVNDWHVNEQCAILLGQIGDKRAVEPLIKRLRPGYGHLMVVIVEALASLGDAWAVPKLLTLLNQNVIGLPEAAARAIVKISDQSSIDVLIQKLDQADPFIRKTAISALVHIGQEAVEPLVKSLDGQNWTTCFAQAEALHQLKWQPDHSPAGIAYCILREDWQGCVAAGPPAVNHLLTILASPNWTMREGALDALDQIGDAREAVLERLIKILHDPSVEVRCKALSILGRLGDARAVSPIISHLKNKSWDERRAAAEALVTLYHSGKLDEGERESVLSYQQHITQPHRDGPLTRGGSDCHSEVYGRADEGIGVPFPT